MLLKKKSLLDDERGDGIFKGFKNGVVEWRKRGECGILVEIDMGFGLINEICDFGFLDDFVGACFERADLQRCGEEDDEIFFIVFICS